MSDAKHSFPKEKIKIILFEKIHPAADQVFSESGYHVERVGDAVSDEELNELIADAHILGIRSRTKIRAHHLAAAKRLLAVGCFSVGTDQVAIDEARSVGVPVFNAPHSSTRSVAELTIGNIIMLARKAGELNNRMHRGQWLKSAAGAMEVRNKTLGIIGFGHIGQQVGILAEALGMNIVFYDHSKKLPFGRSTPCDSLEELLEQSDFVTLHIPGGDDNRNLINEKTLSKMKQGSFLLNLSRGEVVDIDAVARALDDGRLAGAAFDVYPEEPEKADAPFEFQLSNADNVILTPHVGGNTQEAQLNIGREVAAALISFIDEGVTEGAVNFPAVRLPVSPNSHRILYIHRNEPGALTEVNSVISALGVNIDAQYLGTVEDVGYLIVDVNKELSDDVKNKISELDKNIRTRVIY